jgi:hypothetical protein
MRVTNQRRCLFLNLTEPKCDDGPRGLYRVATGKKLLNRMEKILIHTHIPYMIPSGTLVNTNHKPALLLTNSFETI